MSKTLGEFRKKAKKVLIDSTIDDDQVWNLVEEYISHNGIVAHQLDSFNDFIYEGAFRATENHRKLIIESADKTKKYHVEFFNFMFHAPRHTEIDGTSNHIYPMECMYRNITYNASLTCDIAITPPDVETMISKNVLIGYIPVMVKSDLCNTLPLSVDELAKKSEDILDHGGYFITAPNSKNNPGGNANRHIVTPIEKMDENRLNVYSNKKNRDGINAEIKSVCPTTFHVTQLSIKFANGLFTCSFPFIEINDIPIGIIFKACIPFANDELLCELILGPKWKKSIFLEFFISSLEYTHKYTQSYCLYFIGKASKKYKNCDDTVDHNKLISQFAKYILMHEFLPHLNDSSLSKRKNLIKKAIFLSYSLKRMIHVYKKKSPVDSRDDMANKLFVDTGSLLCQQFYGAFRKLTCEIIKHTKTCLDNNKPADILIKINPKIITNAMTSAISNNNWSKDKSEGAAQLFDQYNHLAGLANLNKTNSSSGDDCKIIEQRELDNSHLNSKCPSDTPEGKRVGQVGNRALACVMSPTTDHRPILEILVSCQYVVPLIDMIKNVENNTNTDYIFVNGDLIGKTDQPDELVKYMRRLRRKSSFPSTVSITRVFHSHDPEFNLSEIRINTTSGRSCQVLLIVDPKTGRLVYDQRHIDKLQAGKVSFHELFEKGVIEIVDKEEERTCLVAFKPSDLNRYPNKKFTHCTLHPSLMYGVSGSIIPFSNHNQSPRNTYQCLWQEETVLMADKTEKKIKNIVIGDEICTFDPKTLEIFSTRVIAHLNNVTDKKMLKITVNCRTLVVTNDHKIMTKQGWMESGMLVVGQPVAINLDFSDSETYKSKIVFIPIKSIELFETILISDLTTASDSHCFITGSGFCVHNSAMGKQAIGIPFVNFRQMMTGTFNTMAIIQRPLAISRTSSIVEFDLLPCGQIAMVAIMCDEFNEEDSNAMNKTSIDRGFGVSYKWVCYYAEFRKDKNEILGIPPNSKKNVSLLDTDGIISEGTTVVDGDVLIGKMINIESSMKDCSICYSHTWPAVVDKVQIGTTGEGYMYVRVMTVQKRRPIIGDKFSFCPGQKGTNGMQYNQEDMPYNSKGISPDIILNSLAFPSRMTIALLIEILAGKIVCTDSWLHNTLVNESELITRNDDFDSKFRSNKYPELADATPFRNKVSVEEMCTELKRLGINGFGDEIMYDGRTGKPLKCLVFFGPVYLQRLRHMVIDKIHARPRGGRTTLTRQPPEGRSVKGGLKTGVMERDCIEAQGASATVKDRLFDQSDKYQMTMCSICGIQMDTSKDDKFGICMLCGTNKPVEIPIPYATKLFVQQDMAINIVQRNLA